MTRHLIFLAISVGLGACTQFPELDRTISAEVEAADYPALVPLEPLLTRATADRTDAAATETQLQSRLAGLRARAARLGGPVIGGAARQRLDEGLQ